MIPIKVQNSEIMDRCYKTVIDELKKMLDDAVNNGYIGKFQCKKNIVNGRAITRDWTAIRKKSSRW